MSEVDREMRRYLDRMSGARDASRTDAEYSAQMKWIRRMMELADLAMEDEGVVPESRQRVIRTILYGSPDPDAALRHADRLRMAAETLQQPGALPSRLAYDLYRAAETRTS